MQRTTDLIVATQMSTSVAWLCAVIAHLVENHAPASWHFSVYILLFVSVIFMLFPHIVNRGDDDMSNHINRLRRV